MLSRTLTLTLLASLLLSTGCTENPSAPLQPSGARSGLLSLEELLNTPLPTPVVRRAALLGLFVSSYLSEQGAITPAEGGILGAAAQQRIAAQTATVTDPDYDLLQAFTDALTVDLRDLLNRSTDRTTTLNVYTETLTNIAVRAEERSRTLASVDEELQGVTRSLRREANEAKKAADTAIRNRDFAAAAEAQKVLLEKESAFADADLRLSQVQEVRKALDELLLVFADRILAIDRNREALIAGIRIVDVPGIDDLELIERVQSQRNRRSGGIGTLLQQTGLP